MDQCVLSWGRTFRYAHETRTIGRFERPSSALYSTEKTTVFHGSGRSYGDVALNHGGILCHARQRDNLIEFDRQIGRLKAQSGMTIAELNAITVPAGWIVPVSPGTKFITLGGAIANDVHGKNHHAVGSFGAHITSLKIVRSDGEEMACSRTKNADMFAATISGLGLTGYIEWVELQLNQIKSSRMAVEQMRYSNLDQFFELVRDSTDWPYTAAWVNCFSSAKKLGSGVFTRARFLDDGILQSPKLKNPPGIIGEMPAILLNKYTILSFNWLYKNRPGAQFRGRQSYQKYFYPLDGIANWNRLYGHAGFFQHQSIIPLEQSRSGITELLSAIKASGQGSFLAVLKRHGPETSPGLSSFSMEGVSLALDFPNRGEKTIQLLSRLDGIAAHHGGRMYPAKDSGMSPQIYQTSYPNWQKLEALRDPKISSSFWRRVTQTHA